MKNRKLIETKLKSLKPLLMEKYNVKEIGYFGSFAEGNPSEDSDIDILIDLTEPLGWAFFDLKDFLETQLERQVDLVTKKALKKQLRKKILQQTKFI